MQTLMSLINGTTPTTIAAHDPARDLDAWDDAITDLNDALTDVAAARLTLDQLHRTLDAVEASLSLMVEGKNADERKARLLLVLNDDSRHQQTVSSIAVQRNRLLDAERRVMVAKERCRLLRSAVALIKSTA